MEEHRYDEVIDQCNTILTYEALEGKTKRDIGKKITSARELLERAKEAIDSEKLKVKN